MWWGWWKCLLFRRHFVLVALVVISRAFVALFFLRLWLYIWSLRDSLIFVFEASYKLVPIWCVGHFLNPTLE